jgi:hypothetical protein
LLTPAGAWYARPVFSLLLQVAMIVAAADAAKLPRIAVPDVHATDIDAKFVSVMTEVIASELARTKRYEVMSNQDILAMLNYEQQRQLLDCSSESCMTELGGALGVEKLLGADVANLGKSFVINIKIIDIAGARIDARLNERVEGDMDALIEHLRGAVGRLVGEVEGLAGIGSTVDQPWPAWRWTAIGLGTLGAVAVGFGVFSGNDAKKLEKAANDFEQPGSQLAIEEARSAQRRANLGYAVGAAAGIGAGVLFFLYHGDSGLALAPATDGQGAVVLSLMGSY